MVERKSKRFGRVKKKLITPRSCAFCKEKKTPWYSDVETLRRYLTERGKIIGRIRTGLCAKHQRSLTLAVKYARHLSLLPFIVRA